MKGNSRRSFLKGSVLGAAAMASAPAANAWQQQPGSKPPDGGPPRVSVMCYSFLGLQRAGMMDVFGFLEAVRHRYGLQAGDLWSGFLTSLDESYLKKVRSAYDERDMVCPSLAVDQAQAWIPDPAQREKMHQNALAHLKANRILGSKFVRIDAGGPPNGDKRMEWTSEEFDGIVARFKEYCQFAHDNGFKMGPEVHWGPEIVFANMQKLVEAVNHPAFGILLHFGNFAGTPEEKAAHEKAAAKWTCATHIAWPIVEGPLVERMNFLRDAGYQGYYTAEHHSGRNEYAEVAVQLAKIRAVLDSWRTGGTGEWSQR